MIPGVGKAWLRVFLVVARATVQAGCEAPARHYRVIKGWPHRAFWGPL